MAKIKGVQVSATISPELNKTLEDHHWDARMSKSDVVKRAIEEYAQNHNLPVAPSAQDESAPAEGTTSVV